ncbi:hypothetical protein MRX96_057440 [Rhipicephalus microplus]
MAAAQALKSSTQALYRYVGGVYLNIGYLEQSVLSALSYEPLDGDLFVASYPKCGTTWTQLIVLSILDERPAPTSFMESMSRSPYLEFMGGGRRSCHASARGHQDPLAVPQSPLLG